MNLQHSTFELHFIHGFLGLPSDWEVLSSPDAIMSSRSDALSSRSDALSSRGLTAGSMSFFHSIDEHLDQHEPTFQNWTHSFHKKIGLDPAVKPRDDSGALPLNGSGALPLNDSGALPWNDNTKKKVLIAYSLGSRLALHCLRDFPKTWDGAILISSNPGLMHDEEKKLRIQNDEKWAKRFLEEPWENVLNEWNKQSVFAQYKNSLTRCEVDFQKEKLSKQLTCFSLGRQEDFRPFLKETATPILWISGNQDQKFTQITKEIQDLSNKNISIEIIPNAGHRVPWENSEAFVNQCQHFLNHL